MCPCIPSDSWIHIMMVLNFCRNSSHPRKPRSFLMKRNASWKSESFLVFSLCDINDVLYLFCIPDLIFFSCRELNVLESQNKELQDQLEDENYFSVCAYVPLICPAPYRLQPICYIVVILCVCCSETLQNPSSGTQGRAWGEAFSVFWAWTGIQELRKWTVCQM